MFKIEAIPTARISDALIADRRVFLSDTGAFVREKYAHTFTADEWNRLRSRMAAEGKYDDRITGVKIHAA